MTIDFGMPELREHPGLHRHRVLDFLSRVLGTPGDTRGGGNLDRTEAGIELVRAARTLPSSACGIGSPAWKCTAYCLENRWHRQPGRGPDGGAGWGRSRSSHAEIDRHASRLAALPAHLLRRLPAGYYSYMWSKRCLMRTPSPPSRRRATRSTGKWQPSWKDNILFRRRDRSRGCLQGLPRKVAEPGCNAAEEGTCGPSKNCPAATPDKSAFCASSMRKSESISG